MDITFHNIQSTMSESDSDTESDKIRRTKRSVVVKFNFDDSESGSDSKGPSVNANTLKVSSLCSSNCNLAVCGSINGSQYFGFPCSERTVISTIRTIRRVTMNGSQAHLGK